MNYITRIINEEIRDYTRGIIREGAMSNIEMLAQVYNQLLNGIQTYTCARNEDAGLRDMKVEAALRRGLSALRKQYDKELKIARKRRK